jgi:hypothetical protein
VLSQPLRKRREGQPAAVLAIADRAQQRLHARFVRMTHRGIPYNKVVVAMARELVGFIWATLYPIAADTTASRRRSARPSSRSSAQKPDGHPNGWPPWEETVP